MTKTPSSRTRSRSILDDHQSASRSMFHIARCMTNEKQNPTDLVLRRDLAGTTWTPNGSNNTIMNPAHTTVSSDMRCEESLNATCQILKETSLTEITIRNDFALTLRPAMMDRLLIAVSEYRHETLRIFRCQMSATPRSDAMCALLATMPSLDELHLTFKRLIRDSGELHQPSDGPDGSDNIMPALPARTFDSVALDLLDRADSLSRLTLSLDFTPALVLRLERVVREGRLNALVLVNTGSHLSGHPILTALAQSASLVHVTLERFDLVDASQEALSSPQIEGGDVVNSSLQELVLTHCRIRRGALQLPCRGLRRLSLSHSEVRTDLGRHLLQEQGPEALVQRMLYHATFSSFRILGGGPCPADALFRCQDGTTALQLLRFLHNNPSLTALECVGLPRTLAVREKLEYYLKLNRAGRSLDGLKLVPALWPKLLVRHTDATESRFHPSIMRHLFLKHHSAFVGPR